ncbi:hypothetical protein ZHAS_00016125 [Anopheles sinensis]|uniref:Uncharacterized protein n=1 Tax=Anopheles sinensis TaxID=74873 RepID=A0A084WCR5_ANOSI|nr:hypothetical protein ZHAS_00016125 [Anopheles sinensis]
MGNGRLPRVRSVAHVSRKCAPDRVMIAKNYRPSDGLAGPVEATVAPFAWPARTQLCQESGCSTSRAEHVFSFSCCCSRRSN